MAENQETEVNTNEPVLTQPIQKKKSFFESLNGFFKWCSVFSEWFASFGEIHKKHFNE